MNKLVWLSAWLLTACVTINIYFPAAAADKAADEIIKDIQDLKPDDATTKPQSELTDWRLNALVIIDRTIGVFIATAQAAEPDLTTDSPEIRQTRATMAARFPALLPNYASGLIGIQADGLLVVRNLSAVALKDRNSLTKLVSTENADRLKLYQAIANANGHPEWAEQIKTSFASRWASNAKSGWWFQTANGIWKQK